MTNLSTCGVMWIYSGAFLGVEVDIFRGIAFLAYFEDDSPTEAARLYLQSSKLPWQNVQLASCCERSLQTHAGFLQLPRPGLSLPSVEAEKIKNSDRFRRGKGDRFE